ncbi:hypothetical protein O0235_02325 [Tepidiforma flava]|uniref:Molybdopterin dinucleotide-binding domain-containing protein n=1 Tax=Tepidiforma flava TaxID=3004094 RepID=A0ABY7M7B0_9CHLR|nr:hypothetical protein [Tepidiforma flava]WBL36425.1 hypothetical protein O0235_02325 [Tepidiforma flava]
MRLPGAAAALDAIGTVVVIDGVLNATARRAQAVIAEGRAYASTGTYTAADFRAQRLAAAVRPEGDAVPLWEALQALAKELGVEVPATPDEALGAIAKANPVYEPAWDLIIGEGVKLPVTRASKAAAQPVEAPAAGDGWRVITSRDLYTALDAAALRHPEAEKLHRYDRIQVSEEDARALGIATGDPVRVSGSGASIEAPALGDGTGPAGPRLHFELAAGRRSDRPLRERRRRDSSRGGAGAGCGRLTPQAAIHSAVKNQRTRRAKRRVRCGWRATGEAGVSTPGFGMGFLDRRPPRGKAGACEDGPAGGARGGLPREEVRRNRARAPGPASGEGGGERANLRTLRGIR